MYNRMRKDVISSHAHQPPEEGKALSSEALREQICRILVSGDLDKVNRPVLHDTTYEVIPHLNVFRLRMEDRILSQLNGTHRIRMQCRCSINPKVSN